MPELLRGHCPKDFQMPLFTKTAILITSLCRKALPPASFPIRRGMEYKINRLYFGLLLNSGVFVFLFEILVLRLCRVALQREKSTNNPRASGLVVHSHCICRGTFKMEAAGERLHSVSSPSKDRFQWISALSAPPKEALPAHVPLRELAAAE